VQQERDVERGVPSGVWAERGEGREQPGLMGVTVNAKSSKRTSTAAILQATSWRFEFDIRSGFAALRPTNHLARQGTSASTRAANQHVPAIRLI
jgi:hypothetical protein